MANKEIKLDKGVAKALADGWNDGVVKGKKKQTTQNKKTANKKKQ